MIKTMANIDRIWESIEQDIRHRATDIPAHLFNNTTYRYPEKITKNGAIYTCLVPIFAGSNIFGAYAFLERLKEKREDYCYCISGISFGPVSYPIIVVYMKNTAGWDHDEINEIIKNYEQLAAQEAEEEMERMVKEDPGYRSYEIKVLGRQARYLEAKRTGKEPRPALTECSPEEISRMTAWDICISREPAKSKYIRSEGKVLERSHVIIGADRRAYMTAAHAMEIKLLFADKAYDTRGRLLQDSVTVYIEVPDGDKPWNYYERTLKYLVSENPEYSKW